MGEFARPPASEKAASQFTNVAMQLDDFVHFHEQMLQMALHLRLCQCPAREWCCYRHRQCRRVDHHTSMNTAQSQKLREAVAFAIERLRYIYIYLCRGYTSPTPSNEGLFH